jgi:hypothetical protein
MNQFFQHAILGTVLFTDTREQVHSQPCQPRDIEIARFDLTDKQVRDLKSDIAQDIRIGSGVPVHKAHKNLKFD